MRKNNDEVITGSHKSILDFFQGNCHEKFNTSPVCGLDGVTYSSSCAAAGQLIPIDYEGPCIANVTPCK